MHGDSTDASDVSTSPQSTDEAQPLPGGSFRLLIQKLAYQALMSLGAIENPVTKERETNLAQARMVIDDLLMLEDKTAGNLDVEEVEYLRGVIGELEKNHALQVKGQAPERT